MPAITARRQLVIGLSIGLAACHEPNPDDPAPQVSPEASPEPAPSDPLLVTTEQGQVRGATHGRAQVFRGIPYAAAPVGERRFRAPGAAPSWTGVKDATQFGPVCPQRNLVGAVIGDEDCLSLNLWRPASTRTRPWPVLVFLHGGANAIGSGADPLHGGRHLARDHELIVVTLNYRLGLLGFLAHPALTAESGGSGNWTHLDQIAALEWVARNVAAFGGDPDRVTIVGESAGASAVCVLLASPLAAGTFDAAIMQSGGCDVAPLAQREREGEQLSAVAGCARAPDPIACLRAKPAAELVALAPPVPSEITSWALPIGGAVDGHVLPASPWQQFAASAHNIVPTLVGSNAHETALFTPSTLDSCAAYERALRSTNERSADDVLDAYPCPNDAHARQTYIEATTDSLFTCQARRVLRALAPHAAPTFRYYYAYTRADPAVSNLQAFHGGELQLLFGTVDRFGYELPPAERALAQTMQRSWTSLAKSGTPVHEGTPGWGPYEPARDNAVIFDASVGTADGVGSERCELWDRVSSTLSPQTSSDSRPRSPPDAAPGPE